MLLSHQTHPVPSCSHSRPCRPSLKRHRGSHGQPRALCVKMRTCTGASSSPSSSGRLKSDLAKLEHQIHKTSTIHNIANDSGVSFCAETPSQQSERKATGGSIASIATITPESAPDRASTLRDDATSAAKMAPGRNLALTLPLLPQLDAGLSSGASNVMASPSIIKSDDPFFAQEPAPRSSLSISSTSSQDF